MSTEESKDLARRAWEIVNSGKLDLLEEVYATDLVWHEPDQEVHGIEEGKRYVSDELSAFPDSQVSVEDIIAEGDKVVSRYTIRATHQGETEEYGPPTGRQVELEGITIHRIEDGKIVEEWEAYDNLSMLQQLGLAADQ